MPSSAHLQSGRPPATDAAIDAAPDPAPIPGRRLIPHFTSALAPRRQPFLYLAAALTIGILVDRRLEPALWITAASGAVALAWLAVSGLKMQTWQPGVALLLTVTAAGAGLSLLERRDVQPSRLKRLFEDRVITPDNPVELTGTLSRPPDPAPAAFFIDLKAESVRIKGESIVASGQARLYISPIDAQAFEEFERLDLDAGSRVRVLVRLERARSYANPGSPDFNDFLERRGYDLRGRIKSPLLVETLGAVRSLSPPAWLYRVRLGLLGAIDRQFNKRVGGTLKAMLAGNRYFLDAGVSERLRESGTFHTLVIAGLHIGIIAWALLYLRWDFWRRTKAARRRNFWRAIAALGVLWAYAIMVGLAPPVVRAAAMISVGLIGPLIFRRATSINTVALAAFAILAAKPSLVADPGFQLSVAAVGAIAALALPLIDRLKQIGEWRPTARAPHPPNCSGATRAFAEWLFWNDRQFRLEMEQAPIRYRLEKSSIARRLNQLRLQPIIRAVVLLVITSAAIQAGTLPLMAVYFNRISPIGVALNVTSGLLTATLMLGGLAAIAIAPVSAPLASACVAVVNMAHALLVESIGPFANLSSATFRVPHYEDWHACLYVLYYVPLAGLASMLDRWRPVDHFFPFDPARLPQSHPLAGEAPGGRPIHRSTSGIAAVVFSRRGAVVACATAIVFATAAVIRPAPLPVTGKLTIHFLDVGQGDSALIEFPRGTTMLVDAGGELQFGAANGRPRPDDTTMNPQPDARQPGRQSIDEDDVNDGSFKDDGFAVGEAVVSRFLWSERRDHLDYALVTHADADHIGGFHEVAQNLRIGEAYVGHRPTRNAEYEQFAAVAGRRRMPIKSLAAGDHLEIEGVAIDVVLPPAPDGLPVTSKNNDSIVLRLVYGSVAILLAGDIEEPVESALAQSGLDLHADVVKVPHHGSKTSSTEAFLDLVRPRAAVISVGERSRFGHPHRIVVERYTSRGIRLFQTGRDGMVTVDTDGTRLDLSTYQTHQAPAVY